MDFQTIYDIQQDGVRDWFLPLIPLVLLAIAAKGWLRGEKWSETPGKIPATPQNAAIFAGIFFVITAMATWLSYFGLIEAVDGHTFETVEGPVHDFLPAASEKKPEQFSVDDRTFSYGAYQTKQGFHTLKIEGSPIENGAYVRVSYVHDNIVKLELRRGDAETAH